jgi:hypothetical protein
MQSSPELCAITTTPKALEPLALTPPLKSAVPQQAAPASERAAVVYSLEAKY